MRVLRVVGTVLSEKTFKIEKAASGILYFPCSSLT